MEALWSSHFRLTLSDRRARDDISMLAGQIRSEGLSVQQIICHDQKVQRDTLWSVYCRTVLSDQSDLADLALTKARMLHIPTTVR